MFTKSTIEFFCSSSLRSLVRDVLIATSVGIPLALCTIMAVLQAKRRSLDDYYLPMLIGDDILLRPLVMYAVDMVKILGIL